MKKSPSDALEFILKRWNITPTRRNPIEIPNIDRWDLAKLFFELDMNLGTEIGVLFGRYSKILCEANPKLKLFSIDPWQKYDEYRDLKIQKDFDDLYEKTKTNLAQFNCKIIREKSMDAVKNFPDNFLDFVYIDGNHEFASETNDVCEWSKKVRPGGIISGHDYLHYRQRSYSHSYEVVNAYTCAYRITPWFVTERSSKDPIRSWFWVKS